MSFITQALAYADIAKAAAARFHNAFGTHLDGFAEPHLVAQNDVLALLQLAQHPVDACATVIGCTLDDRTLVIKPPAKIRKDKEDKLRPQPCRVQDQTT